MHGFQKLSLFFQPTGPVHFSFLKREDRHDLANLFSPAGENHLMPAFTDLIHQLGKMVLRLTDRCCSHLLTA